MPWITPDPDYKPDQEAVLRRERDFIRATIPDGWSDHHAVLTYGFDILGRELANLPIRLPRMYGVCGHRRVCLMVGGEWRHPYPHKRECDQPPQVAHQQVDL